MTRPGIVVALFLFTCFGTLCGLGGYLIGHGPAPKAKPAECQTTKVRIVESRDCPPCKKKDRPIIFPKMNCPHTKCADELEACREMLEGIKKWCDPNCQEYLEACDNELQEYKYTPYPFRHPYFP